MATPPHHAVPGPGLTMPGMTPSRTRTMILPVASCPVKGESRFLDGDRPWIVRRLRVLPDGRVQVTLTR
ncbi:hypothetical protein HNQ07_004320 [Deinococcus metalli]|uniref:Uncharacterized protein n=1 Tax=Deinococcus metalli TaxID=1141878 RepID=A0A7W8NT80_9DEIO|nr:hypothetical protein [Deinococcus metalli]MBB5378813.1 hypothetical protein [Deinococcus metalli]GHF60577.1 hypothetical protein GCM10017781_40980 [Deinococcus metalli]